MPYALENLPPRARAGDIFQLPGTEHRLTIIAEELTLNDQSVGSLDVSTVRYRVSGKLADFQAAAEQFRQQHGRDMMWQDMERVQ